MSDTAEPDHLPIAPEIPSRQSWHAALAPLFQEAGRSSFFARPRWLRVMPSAALFVVLFLIGTALQIGLQRLYIVGPADFNWHAVLAGWFVSSVVVWVCYLLGTDNGKTPAGQRVAPAQLFALAWTQSLIVSLIVGALYVLVLRTAPGTFKSLGTAGRWIIWLGPVGWSLAALLKLVLQANRTGAGRRALAGLALLAIFGISLYAQPPTYWYQPEPEDDNQPRAHLPLSQETMEAQQHLLVAQLAQIKTQRPGVIDMYAITFAPYAEESVFRKESGVVAEVMARRFDTAGRTMQLLNHNETIAQFPWATPLNLQRAIAHFASVMDRNEDILFLHLTSHGARNGALSASLWPLEVGSVTPASLKKWLDDAGVRNRVISISACYSGSWIAPLANDDTLVMTASDADHTSYGCGSRSELTFFGRAMYDEQLRNQTLSFEQAHSAARVIIKKREEEGGKDDGYSNPQIRIGAAMRARLAQLEQRLKSSKP